MSHHLECRKCKKINKIPGKSLKSLNFIDFVWKFWSFEILFLFGRNIEIYRPMSFLCFLFWFSYEFQDVIYIIFTLWNLIIVKWKDISSYGEGLNRSFAMPNPYCILYNKNKFVQTRRHFRTWVFSELILWRTCSNKTKQGSLGGTESAKLGE